jgi:hypothetical protein
MNRWRVGEDMGSKETDGCPLTAGAANDTLCTRITTATLIQGAHMDIPHVDTTTGVP